MKSLARVCAILAIVSSFLFVPVTQAQEVSTLGFSVTAGPFEFHSSMWINLHHFLYMNALPVPSSALPPILLPEMPQVEQKTWNDAVEFYRQHMVQFDFVGSDLLERMDSYLAKQENLNMLSEDVIGKKIAAVLNSVGPIYKRYWWTKHDSTNQFWIKTVQPLILALGPSMQTQLTNAYETTWPSQAIRVDVSIYANWGGAYTNIEDGGLVHTVMSSVDPGYQGFGAIEMLFHEASHSMVDGDNGKLGQAIHAQAKAHGIAVPDQFWHALIFYTAGECARRDLSKMGVHNYRPYVEQQGISKRSSVRNYYSALSVFWEAHLDGKLSLTDAVSDMMNALAIAQSK